MAEPHAAAPANPDIAYESKDINPRAVFWAGVGFVALNLFSAVVALATFLVLREREVARNKERELPEAAVDVEKDDLPPIPLEQIEDVYPQRGDVQLWPRRSRKGISDQAKAIDREIGRLANKLPVRPGSEDETAPPAGWERRLPSKASSGRTDTGEQ
jgi:hypothetical protein